MEAIGHSSFAGTEGFISLAVRRKLELTYHRWGATQNKVNITVAQAAPAILADKRAMRQLETLHLMDEQEKKGAKDVLRAAATTYVAGESSSEGYIIYLLIITGCWVIQEPPLPSPPLRPPPLP